MAGGVVHNLHILIPVDKLRHDGNSVLLNLAELGIFVRLEYFISFLILHPAGVFKVCFNLL